MNQPELFSYQSEEASLFDAIKRTRPDGSEFWTGRDLMPMNGYASWQKFEAVIERAKASAENQGISVPENFTIASKVSGTRGPDQADVHLSRFAAYLVAMNGDPRKPEVAAAQAYFAIQTRIAETAVKPLSGAALLAQAVIEAQSMLAVKDERIAELEPKAEVADRLLKADGDLSVADTAKVLTRGGLKLGQDRLFTVIANNPYGWVFRGADRRWRVKQSAIEAGFMSVLPQSHYHPRTGILVEDVPQPRITPRGMQRLLNDHTRS